MKKEKKLICTVHNEILNIAQSLLDTDYNEMTFREFKKLPTLIKKSAKEILSLTEEALEDGQLMEDRLIEYHNAIKDLGFIRVKK